MICCLYSAVSSPCPPRWRPGSRRRRVIVASLDCHYDVLVLDATNVLSGVAAADRRRMAAAKGYNLRAAFADWVGYCGLLADAALTIACFDAPKGQRAGPGQRAALEQSYLQRRRRQAESKAAAASQGARGQGTGKAAAGGGGLYPFLQHIEELGAISVVAVDGWEADDCVAATCNLIEGSHPSLSIAVASGDSDMQQLLSPRVSWLHLLPSPSLEQPLGVEVVTAEAFERQQGFSPTAYPDYLAFIGKPASSVGGVGTGAATAAKLLKRYGSIERIEAAAARGELAGWSPAVQRLFCDGGNSAKRQLLERNRQLFAINRSPDTMLGAQQRGEILRQAAKAAAAKAAGMPAGASSSNSRESSSHPGSQERRGDPEEEEAAGPGQPAAGHLAAKLAWRHPLHASRRRHNQPDAEALASWLRQRGAAVEAWAVTPKGLPADVLLQEGGHLLGADPRPVALLVAGPYDFQPGAALAGPPNAAAAGTALAAGQGELSSAAGQSGAVLRQLVGAVQLHARQLKKEGLQVMCIPWWQVPQGYC